MSDTPDETQEKQSERGTVMLTPTEKRDVRLVAAFDQISESDLYRWIIPTVRERADAIRAGRARAA